MSRVRILFVMLLLGTLGPSAARAQSGRQVTGVVTDAASAPLTGVAVQVVGTTAGTYTGDAGRFTLAVPGSASVTLRVRRIGFKQQLVQLPAGQTEANVRLERDVLQLETQVVTGVATAVASVNAANAVSVVSGEQLNRVPSPTVDQALQGKIAGATISQNSGAPGGGTQVQLRGISTINGGYSPLYVIDGVIVNNAAIQNGLNVISQAARGNFSSSQDQTVNRVADLNPNDIESIQVLKGPAASSIYGSKGTNGVIIITTKQGGAGRATVNFTQRVGQFQLANKLGSRCFGSGQEYADWAAGTLGADAPEDIAENIAAFDAAPTKCNDYEEQFYGSNDDLSYQSIASVRGGTNTGTTFYLSGLVQHDNGLAQNDQYNKQSIRLNLGQTLGSRVTLRANTELLHTLTQRGISGNDNAGINPYTIFSATPSFVDLRRRADGTYPVNPSPLLPGSNPFQNADLIKTPENVYRLIGSLTGTVALYNSSRQTLNYTMTGGIDSYADRARIISPSTTYTESQNGALAGTLFNSDANFVNANLQGTFAHQYVVTPFTATTSVGFRQERRESSITQLTGRGVVFPTVTNVSQASQTFPNQTQALSKDFALFAQEEFLTLSERLLLTAGVNAERTSNNGDQERFYAYPKFSASYRVPGLPDFINELKPRVAFGQAGNQPTAGRFTFLQPLLYEGTTGARASIVQGAREIKPEVAREIEGGFDITFARSRVRLSATQYRKQIDDLILQAAIAPSTGFTSQFINGGRIVNTGTEIEVNATPIQRDGFDWVSNTTFSTTKGVVDSLPVAPFVPGVGSFGPTFGNAFLQQGQRTSVIQARAGCSVPLTASGSCPAAGRIIGFVGDANPDFQMGFNNAFTLGPVRLSSLFDWRKGGDVVNLTNLYFDGNNITADTLAGQRRLAGLAAAQPVYVEDAGFVKLREVTLSYGVPQSVSDRLFGGRAQDTRLEFSGRNLYTWTDYTGLDPEVSNFGSQALGRFQDVTPYPPSRAFFLSINTSF